MLPLYLTTSLALFSVQGSATLFNRRSTMNWVPSRCDTRVDAKSMIGCAAVCARRGQSCCSFSYQPEVTDGSHECHLYNWSNVGPTIGLPLHTKIGNAESTCLMLEKTNGVTFNASNAVLKGSTYYYTSGILNENWNGLDLVNQSTAARRCFSLGMQLVSIKTKQDQQNVLEVLTLFNFLQEVWTSGRVQNGSYIWRDGTTVSSGTTNWIPLIGNVIKAGYCIKIIPASAAMWQGVDCSKQYGFMCQYTPPN